MKNLVKHVQEVNHRHGLWAHGETLVIGVSGGRDSMCLLDVARIIAEKEDLTLVIAHVNYGLRGSEADMDEEIVRVYTQKYDLSLTTKYFDGSDAGTSEAAWRERRYAFFEDVRKENDAQRILIAHTQNDQAETLLLNLLRGAGLQGLRAMRYKNENGMIVRPLLGVTREEVTTYVVENSIAYRDDETNDDAVFLRNRVRTELLPLLQKNYQKEIIATLAASTEILGDEYDFMQKNVPIDLIKKTTDRFSFSLEAFIQLHTAQQRLLLRALIEKLQGSTKNISFSLIEEMRKALHSTKGKNQEVSFADLKMVRKGATVDFTLQEK